MPYLLTAMATDGLQDSPSSSATTVPAKGPGFSSRMWCGPQGRAKTMPGPYQQLIPAWPALALPFSETPTLILTHGMFTSDSALIADRAETIPP